MKIFQRKKAIEFEKFYEIRFREWIEERWKEDRRNCKTSWERESMIMKGKTR